MCTFSGHFLQGNRPTKINENCLLIWFQLLVLKYACVVLKSAFFLTSCVFGSCFRTLAVNSVSDLFFSLLFSFSGIMVWSLAFRLVSALQIGVNVWSRLHARLSQS